MNKEEIEKAFKKLIHCSDNNDIHHSVPISLRECTLLMNEFNQLQQENKALKKEIEMCDKKIDNLRLSRDKAIEFLKLAKESGVISIRIIEEILKGE